MSSSYFSHASKKSEANGLHVTLKINGNVSIPFPFLLLLHESHSHFSTGEAKSLSGKLSPVCLSGNKCEVLVACQVAMTTMGRRDSCQGSPALRSCGKEVETFYFQGRLWIDTEECEKSSVLDDG